MTRATPTPLAGFVVSLALALSACDGANERAEAPEATHEEAEGPERIVIPAASAQASGIVIAQAGPGAIRETLVLTGRIVLQPSARAEVHAPYAGPVRAVTLNVGDTVRRGQVLARVESAESLQVYAIVSPISGVILERQTNVGDVTSEAPLFIVGDLTSVQAELNVGVRDIGRVAPGQTVRITALDGASVIETRVSSVLPMADAHSQTLLARAPFSIAANSPFRPGMAVRGAVVLTEQQAAIAVPRDAVQVIEGQSVVFVRVAPETYEVRPVTLGRASQDTIEIISGLGQGDAYVSANAFLVKAELGENAASHGH